MIDLLPVVLKYKKNKYPILDSDYEDLCLDKFYQNVAVIKHNISMMDENNTASLGYKIKQKIDAAKSVVHPYDTGNRIILNITNALNLLLTKKLYDTPMKTKPPTITQEYEFALRNDTSLMLLAPMNKLDLANEVYNFNVMRYKQVMQLERSLNELHQLFVDMAVLVYMQGEIIDRIAFRISNAKDDVVEAKEQLVIAYKVKHKKCTIQ